jgi:biopolymer transport protein ExbD
MARRLREAESERAEARIEIVPLIDIMFFLLATFILATLGMSAAGALAPVKLPEAGKTQAGPMRAATLAVSASGDLLLEGSPVGRNELVGALASRHQAEPGLRVLVQADARAPFAAVSRALEALSEAGVREVSFAAEPKGP